MTIIVALQYEYFGGILGLIISWFGALVGPIAVPMLFGIIPAFKSCGPISAISSIFAGLLTFIITKNIEISSLALQVSLPLIVSTLVYVTIGLIQIGTVPEKVKSMLQEISKE
jgi:hypothetical protein